LARLGEIEEAQPLAEQVVGRIRRIQGENHPDTLMTISNLAEILRELESELPAAKGHATDAVNGLRRVRGVNHPHALSAASNLTEILRRLGELSEALALGEDTLARQRAVLGASDPRTQETAGILDDIHSDIAQADAS
jgi:hypothetical protein